MLSRPKVPEGFQLPELPIAEVPRRTAAYVIDVVLVASILMPIQALVFVIAWGSKRPEWLTTGPEIYAWEWVSVSLPVWIYFTWYESGPRGATIGKRLLGLRVTTPLGEPIRRGRAFLRTLLKLLPWEMTHVAVLLPTPMWDAGNDAAARPMLIISTVLFGAWFGAVLLVPKAQGVHDLIAGTLVLDRRGRATPSEHGVSTD